jgi:hypothetical protein
VGANVVEIVDDVGWDVASAIDVVGVDVAPTSADPGAIVTVADGCVGLESAMACVAVADSTMDGVPCAVVGVDVALTVAAVASVDSAKLCGKLSSDINSEGVGVDDVDLWCWSPYCAGSDATVSYWTVISPVLGS